jgi:hypothetical protein
MQALTTAELVLEPLVAGHAQAMLGHVACGCGVSRFLASVEAANQSSIRLLGRLGFREASGRELMAHELSPTERLFVKMTAA